MRYWGKKLDEKALQNESSLQVSEDKAEYKSEAVQKSELNQSLIQTHLFNNTLQQWNRIRDGFDEANFSGEKDIT